jgi:hypothetical protein
VAPRPPQPIAKSNASSAGGAYRFEKFVDALPLYRIETIFSRMTAAG